MKLLKNPVFIGILCVIVVIASTLLTSRRGLEKQCDHAGEYLCDSIIDFASENGSAALEANARACLAHLSANRLSDYDALILQYTDAAVGLDKEQTYAVDQAIKAYSRFVRMTERFPASVYVSLFDLF